MRFAGRTDFSLVREFFRIHGLAESPEHFALFFEHYVFWLHHILEKNGGETCAGVGKFIGDLQALPQPPALGLLTGNIRLGAEIKLRHFGLWEIFRAGGFADDTKTATTSPSPRSNADGACSAEICAAQEILVVGDTPHDVRCGQVHRRKSSGRGHRRREAGRNAKPPARLDGGRFDAGVRARGLRPT